MAVDHRPCKTQGRYALGRAPTGRNKAAAGTEQAVQHRKSRAEVVYEGFGGLSRIQQHQMVYDVFEGEIGGPIHALSLKTSPKENHG